MALDWLSNLANLFRSENPYDMSIGSTTPAGYGMSGRGFGSIDSTPTPDSGLYGGFKDFSKAVVPGLAMAGTAGLMHALFPGKKSKIVSTDVRTGTGSAAEAERLKTAQTASGQLQSSFTSPFGALTPEEQARIKSQSRGADAARGMLETGGSGARENRALAEANQRRIDALYGNINSLTSGYQPKAPALVPGQADPWGSILTYALAPAVGKGFGSILDKWWV